MSTGKNAAIALRNIRNDPELRNRLPANWQYERCRAFDALALALAGYAANLEAFLDAAYNTKCRVGGWQPNAPLGTCLLSSRAAEWLHYDKTDEELYERIASSAGFKALEAAAREAEVLLKLSVRPDGVSITCDFRKETAGEARLAIC